MLQEPLGLPQGSVRAFLAALLNVGMLIYVIAYQDFPTELMTLVGLVDGYYFGTRDRETVK